MSKNLPAVSIIIPFNRDRGWLNEAIESIHNQTYRGKIYLLRSDIINPDTHKGFSCAQNINVALPYCKGEYIKFMAEDDLLTPICIEASVEAMKEQGCDFLHGNAFNFTGNVNTPHYPPIQVPTLPQLIGLSMIHGLTLFYKAEVLKSHPLDETITCCEEYDLNMKLLKEGYKLGYVNKFLGRYRRHDEQKSLGKSVDQAKRFTLIESIRDRYRNNE